MPRLLFVTGKSFTFELGDQHAAQQLVVPVTAGPTNRPALGNQFSVKDAVIPAATGRLPGQVAFGVAVLDVKQHFAPSAAKAVFTDRLPLAVRWCRRRYCQRRFLNYR